MEDFKARLLDEQNELSERLAKLGTFANENPKFRELSEEVQGLMIRQMRGMETYLENLEKRIVLLVTKEDIAEYLNPSEIVCNKQLRKQLDALLQDLKSLPLSRERSLAITKLQECIMWLGMDLKRLNPDNDPYPSSMNPSTGDKVEVTADGLKL